MSGILEQLIARVTALETAHSQAPVAAAVVAQPAPTLAAQPVPAAVGAVSADMIMAVVNGLVENPSAKAEMIQHMASMGIQSLEQATEAQYANLYTGFKAIHDRYTGAPAATAGLGGLGGGLATPTVAAAPAII